MDFIWYIESGGSEFNQKIFIEWDFLLSVIKKILTKMDVTFFVNAKFDYIMKLYCLTETYT